MANKWFERFGSTKTRTLALLGAALLLIILVVTYFFTKKSTPLETEQSQAAGIPQISSVPGQVTSERYQQLLEAANAKRAEEAKKQGTSAVATIIGSRDKDALAKKETFGIEDQFLKAGNCKCPSTSGATGTGEEICQQPMDPAISSKLIAQIEKDPKTALQLMQTNTCLSKALCTEKPDLALKVIENDPVAAKIMLNECPAMANALAEKNPELFKKLMLDNPELAKKIAATNPELLNKLMLADPEFAKKLLLSNPDLAKKIAATNPELLKKLMLADPEFAKKLAQSNPELVKNLMKADPDFADQLAKSNPELVKELMRNDSEFAKTLAKNNPGLVKALMLSDPEFAKLMAHNNPDMVKELMRNDPDFANKLAKSNPTLVKELMKNDPEFAALMAKQNPDMVKELMLNDPEFAKIMARNNPDMVNALMKNDPDFAKALLSKNPGLAAILNSSAPKPFATDQERVAALEAERKRQQQAEALAAQKLQLTELQQKQVAAIMANMESQSKSAFQAWNDINQQQFVQGEWAQKEDAQKGGIGGPGGTTVVVDQASGGPPGGPSPVLLKAGDVLFAVLDTSVSTDEPGPILATIVQGKFKGAKILGTVQPAVSEAVGSRPEKVILNFATLSSPAFPNSIGIRAVAIDPDTARTALASDVDHHYLLRYGTLFASSFMTGYAKVITSEGTVQTTAQNGQAATTTLPQLSGRKEIFAALGEVGKRLGDATAEYFNTPNTITVDAGTGFGLLILSDVNAGT